MAVKKRIEKELPGVRVFDLEATYLPWIDFNPLGLSPEKIIQIIEEKAGLARTGIKCHSFIRQSLSEAVRNPVCCIVVLAKDDASMS